MDNAGFSGKPPDFSTPPVDDIPEALRETSSPVRRPRSKPSVWVWGFVGLAIALLSGLVLSLPYQFFNTAQSATSPAKAGLQMALIDAGIPMPNDALLGHLPYEEAPTDELETITADGKLKLRRPAAERFVEMAATAAADDVILVPLSGFRSVKDQEYVFFNVKAQQGERPVERAEVSAPPGYSEHHTGYALDISDGSNPETDLEISFDTTPAFRWLERNAARFNFELSFPENNRQHVSYEPWHWRFVGDRTSLETFYRARVLNVGRRETP